MSFLDTEPAAIDSRDFAGPWTSFRVGDPRLRMATLRELCRNDVPLAIGLPGGPSLSANLWSVDDVKGRLHLKVVTGAEHAATLCVQPNLWAAAYLDAAKVQFDVRRMVLEGPPGDRTLSADTPREMFHLPRRRAVRVRRDEGHAPCLRFAHPVLPERPVRMRVMDISTSGCALWKAAGELPLAPGNLIRAVEVELEADTFVYSDLRVRHVTLNSSHAGRAGARVGCSWQGMALGAQETLQRWIRRGRRRRDLVSLSLD